MSLKVWTRNGRVITDASGRPILCDACPCPTDTGTGTEVVIGTGTGTVLLGGCGISFSIADRIFAVAESSNCTNLGGIPDGSVVPMDYVGFASGVSDPPNTWNVYMWAAEAPFSCMNAVCRYLLYVIYTDGSTTLVQGFGAHDSANPADPPLPNNPLSWECPTVGGGAFGVTTVPCAGFDADADLLPLNHESTVGGSYPLDIDDCCTAILSTLAFRLYE